MRQPTLQRLWRAFRRENGDADPLMTVVSVAISAILTTAVAGALTTVVLVGSGYVNGQSTRSTIQQAQQLWSATVQDASTVTVTGTTQVVTYSFPDDQPGVYQQTNQDDVCVKTTWSLATSTLTAIQQRWNNANCDRTNPSATPTSSITAATISGLSNVTIAAYNGAGRDLHFDGSGNEVGLTSGTPSLQSVKPQPAATIASTQDWTSTAPRTLNLTATAATSAGNVSINFLGTTSLRPGVTTANVNPGLYFTPLNLLRIYSGTVGTTAVTIPVAGQGTVPAGAVAVVLNVEPNSPTATGVVRVTPAGTPASFVSQAFPSGQTYDNLQTVTLNGGKVSAVLSSGSATLALDVEGYYSTNNSASTFTPLANVRAFAAVAVTTTYKTLTFGGLDGIPAAATAVAINVQITSPSATSSVRMMPNGATDAAAAMVNDQSGVQAANAAIVPLNAGVAEIRASSGTATANIDVVGYYSTSATGALYVPLPIQRGWTGALNTTPTVITVTNNAGVPGNAVAVVANFEVLGESTAAWFRVTPAGSDPGVVTGTYTAAQAESTMASVMLNSGQIQIHTQTGSIATAYMDVEGYFQPVG